MPSSELNTKSNLYTATVEIQPKGTNALAYGAAQLMAKGAMAVVNASAKELQKNMEGAVSIEGPSVGLSVPKKQVSLSSSPSAFDYNIAPAKKTPDSNKTVEYPDSDKTVDYHANSQGGNAKPLSEFSAVSNEETSSKYSISVASLAQDLPVNTQEQAAAGTGDAGPSHVSPPASLERTSSGFAVGGYEERLTIPWPQRIQQDPPVAVERPAGASVVPTGENTFNETRSIMLWGERLQAERKTPKNQPSCCTAASL